MEGVLIAFLKIFIIVVPLCTGLLTYDYMNLDFCKSLFLYALTLLFDAGIQFNKTEKSNERGVVIYIILALLVVISTFLTAISVVGIFVPDWLKTLAFIFEAQKFVYAGIFLEACWYGVEATALFVCQIAKKLMRKSPVSVSHSSDAKYNI